MVKRYFTRKKEFVIQHLSEYTDVTGTRFDGPLGLKILESPRSLKEMMFIKVSPTIYEIDEDLKKEGFLWNKAYLTFCYKFATRKDDVLFNVLDEHMSKYYPNEYWEIIFNPPNLAMYSSVGVNIDDIFDSRVDVNYFIHYFNCIGSPGMWYKGIFTECEYRSFLKIVCNGPDSKTLNDMLAKQIYTLCERSRHYEREYRHMLAYDVVFCVYKSVVLDMYYNHLCLAI